MSSDAGGGMSHQDQDMARNVGLNPDLSSGDLAQGPPIEHYTRRGLVNIINSATATTNVSAHFWSFPAGACTITDFGSCTVTSCTAGTVLGPELDGGTITLGGGTQAESLVFNGAAYRLTSPLPAGTPTWPSGATATINAAGATVPAFNTLVTMPVAITTLTAPGLTGTITRNQDIAVAWSGGSAQILVEIVGSAGVGPSLQCSFPAAAQSGTIPQAALAAMPTGSYALEVFAADVQTVAIGDGFAHVSCGISFRTMSIMLQ
jgi:hypothetical protein